MKWEGETAWTMIYAPLCNTSRLCVLSFLQRSFKAVPRWHFHATNSSSPKMFGIEKPQLEEQWNMQRYFARWPAVQWMAFLHSPSKPFFYGSWHGWCESCRSRYIVLKVRLNNRKVELAASCWSKLTLLKRRIAPILRLVLFWWFTCSLRESWWSMIHVFPRSRAEKHCLSQIRRSITLNSHLTTYIRQAVNNGRYLFIISGFFLK